VGVKVVNGPNVGTQGLQRRHGLENARIKRQRIWTEALNPPRELKQVLSWGSGRLMGRGNIAKEWR
jgi:hypothetical protein